MQKKPEPANCLKPCPQQVLSPTSSPMREMMLTGKSWRAPARWVVIALWIAFLMMFEAGGAYEGGTRQAMSFS